MDNDSERNTPPEAARALPPRKHGRAGGGRASIGDIGIGVTCGLAAVGIAAGAWIGALGSPGNAAGTAAGSGQSSWPGDPAGGRTITVNVTTFGSLRSVIGGYATRVTMPEGSTVGALSDRLADIYPALAPSAMLAIDDSYEMLPLDKVLSDGQSVELIGSMAGG